MSCRWVCTGVRMKYCNSFGASGLGQDALPIPHCAIAPKTPRRPGDRAHIPRDVHRARVCARIRAREREWRYDLRWISVNSFFGRGFSGRGRENERGERERERHKSAQGVEGKKDGGRREREVATGCGTVLAPLSVSVCLSFSPRHASNAAALLRPLRMQLRFRSGNDD